MILATIRFLARQELALRRDVEESSNLIQILRLRAEDKPEILQWIEKSVSKLSSPENQRKTLEMMAHHGLRKIFENIHSPPFVAVMVDQTTDKSNQEQLTLVLRWISEDFVVSEEFVGLYYLSAIDAQSIVEVMKDAFIRFQVPLHGQCYDGSSTMAGAKAGVSTKMPELEARAVFLYCYGHALNLAVSDTIKQSCSRHIL